MPQSGWADPRRAREPDAFATFLAHFLILLAAWTVTIKFLFPAAFALADGRPLATYVWWDFWWVVHLWLAWALLRRPAYTRLLALYVSAAEIAIILTKLALFLAAPEWTIWASNWFINKLFVLACFLLILPYSLFSHPRAAASAVPEAAAD
jgi:hypothetical protein